MEALQNVRGREMRLVWIPHSRQNPKPGSSRRLGAKKQFCSQGGTPAPRRDEKRKSSQQPESMLKGSHNMHNASFLPMLACKGLSERE